MTTELLETLADHSAGTYRLLMLLGAELLAYGLTHRSMRKPEASERTYSRALTSCRMVPVTSTHQSFRSASQAEAKSWARSTTLTRAGAPPTSAAMTIQPAISGRSGRSAFFTLRTFPRDRSGPTVARVRSCRPTSSMAGKCSWGNETDWGTSAGGWGRDRAQLMWRSRQDSSPGGRIKTRASHRLALIPRVT